MLWANNDLKSRQGEWRFAPQFEMEQNGQPTRDWTCPSMIYSDVTGNTHASFLCPHEPALKLSIELARTMDARFDSNELWSTPEMAAPEPGKFQVLSGSGTIDGVTIRLATLSGPGVVTYSNGIPIKATPPDGALRPLHVTSSSVASGNSAYIAAELKSDCWVLALGITGLKPGHDLLIFAIDDHGRKTMVNGYNNQEGNIFFHYALDALGERAMGFSSYSQPKAICFLSMPVDATTKTIRMNFVIQKRRKMEFLFKPSELIQEVSSQSTPQAIPPVSNSSVNGKGFIDGIPAKEFRHKSAQDFLKSLAKDTYEGQKIATELSKNGFGIEYIYPIYSDAYRLANMKENGWTRDGNMDAAVKRMKDMILGGRSFQMSRIPMITNQILLSQLLDLTEVPIPEHKNFDGKVFICSVLALIPGASC
jgi:hypothetical protein